MLTPEQRETGIKKLTDYLDKNGDQITEEQAYRELYPDEIGRGGFASLFDHVVYQRKTPAGAENVTPVVEDKTKKVN